MTTYLSCTHSDLRWPACLDGLAPPLLQPRSLLDVFSFYRATLR